MVVSRCNEKHLSNWIVILVYYLDSVGLDLAYKALNACFTS